MRGQLTMKTFSTEYNAIAIDTIKNMINEDKNCGYAINEDTTFWIKQFINTMSKSLYELNQLSSYLSDSKLQLAVDTTYLTITALRELVDNNMIDSIVEEMQ